MDLIETNRKIKEAKAARLRYAAKRAAELGVDLKTYLDNKKEKKNEQKKKRKVLAAKRRKQEEKLLKERVDRINSGKERRAIEFQSFSLTVPFSTFKQIASEDVKGALERMSETLEVKKLAYYDGDEQGAHEVRWYFYLYQKERAKRTDLMRAVKLVSTLLKKKEWGGKK